MKDQEAFKVRAAVFKTALALKPDASAAATTGGIGARLTPITTATRAVVIEQAVSEASASMIGRWLAEDAIRPWRYKSWIFLRDPDFLDKAGRVLDLYAGRWEGKLLEPGDMVISADAKPSIQACKRIHPSAQPRPVACSASSTSTSWMGSVCYHDAWDVRRGDVIGRSERKGGNETRRSRSPRDHDRTCGGQHYGWPP